MAIFPELIPSTRTYSPGAFPHTRHGVYNGSEVRVRHSNTVLGVRLRLFFPALTTADLLLVIAHYNGQRGRFLPFAIPDELLSGTTAPADFTPAGHQWRYAVKPAVEDVSVDGTTPSNLHNLTVELETVPPENTIVQGARLRARASLQAGSPQLGRFLDVETSLDVGDAFPQVDLMATASLQAGSPFPVVGFDVVATITAGAATTTSTDPYTVVISLSPGSSSNFDPLALSPLAWWDASDETTIATSSGLITDWDDKSGNGWHLAQATSADRAAYVTAAVNGLNAAEWPSTDNSDFLKTAASSFEWREMYAVVQFDGSAFTNFEGLFTGGSNGGADGWVLGRSAAFPPDTGWFFTMKTYLNANNATDRQTNLFPELSSTCLLRCDPDTPRQTNSGVVIGNDRTFTSSGRGWHGYICEVIVFASVLSSGDRGGLETHLMDKWNV